MKFFFDFVSPYSYLAWLQIPSIRERHGIQIELYPTLLAGLLAHHGSKGPAEVEPKRLHMLRSLIRETARQKIPLTLPKFHPFNPLLALRLALPEVSGKGCESVITAIYEAGWVRGMDIGDPKTLAEVLESKGLPAKALLELAASDVAKAKLKANTQLAIELGVFGVPSFIVKDEMIWGVDQLHVVEELLSGKDLLDKAKYEELKQRKPSAMR